MKALKKNWVSEVIFTNYGFLFGSHFCWSYGLRRDICSACVIGVCILHPSGGIHFSWLSRMDGGTGHDGTHQTDMNPDIRHNHMKNIDVYCTWRFPAFWQHPCQRKYIGLSVDDRVIPEPGQIMAQHFSCAPCYTQKAHGGRKTFPTPLNVLNSM